MAYTTIKKPSDYFNTVLYTGNGTTNTGITGVNFQPDFTWIKNRTSADAHILFDIIRGATYRLNSNTSNAQASIAESLKSFDSDGFTVGTYSEANTSGQNYTSWNWLASNTTASNNDGSITSTVSANTTSGFSIVTYTLPSSGTVTVGHGLGVKPDVLITKSTSTTYNWDILHHSINDNGVGRMTFTTNGYLTGSNPYASTTPTSSVFSFSADFYGAHSNVTYCFSEVKGFSKFGSYVGNSSTDGTFVFCGFKPAFVMVKKTDATAHWRMFDNKREGYNVDNDALKANATDAETTTDWIDLLSNGFKLRSSDTAVNGGTLIYMAFADEPLVGDNPATAR